MKKKIKTLKNFIQTHLSHVIINIVLPKLTTDMEKLGTIPTINSRNISPYVIWEMVENAFACIDIEKIWFYWHNTT